jgi:hypothetical protein
MEHRQINPETTYIECAAKSRTYDLIVSTDVQPVATARELSYSSISLGLTVNPESPKVADFGFFNLSQLVKKCKFVSVESVVVFVSELAKVSANSLSFIFNRPQHAAQLGTQYRFATVVWVLVQHQSAWPISAFAANQFIWTID